MFIGVRAQRISRGGSRSVRSFVNYLEKENLEKAPENHDLFYNQELDQVNASQVVQEIDTNAYGIKKQHPRYYSLLVGPSTRELEHIDYKKESLREYTRELMKQYAAAFNREIDGKPVTVQDIRYFAKIESFPKYKFYQQEVIENAPYVRKICRLEKKIRKIRQGTIKGHIFPLEQELKQLYNQVPHKNNGKIIVQDMKRDRFYPHIHIVVSRKDASNRYSLSPGSKYRKSNVMMHGKLIRRGFNRDLFCQLAEKSFDRIFHYNRNYTESYQAQKMLKKDPLQYYNYLHRLPPSEKRAAFKVLAQNRARSIPLAISPAQVSFALKQIKKALDHGLKASSITY